MADSVKASTRTRLGPCPPKPRGDAGRGGIEQGKAAGQQRDGKGEQHGEDLGLDEEGLADPEQAGQEIAEAEPPADGSGGDFGALVPARRNVAWMTDCAGIARRRSATPGRGA